MKKMKYTDNIPVLIGKTDEQINTFYEEIIPFALLENYPVYRYAELFGIPKDNNKVLTNVRFALYQIKQENKRRLSKEEALILAVNIKKMKSFYTRVNLSNLKFGKFDEKTDQIIMIEPTPEQINTALTHMYLNGEYICQTILLKTLRKMLITKELNYEKTKDNLKQLTSIEETELEKRKNMIAIEMQIPTIDLDSLKKLGKSATVKKEELALAEIEFIRESRIKKIKKLHS